MAVKYIQDKGKKMAEKDDMAEKDEKRQRLKKLKDLDPEEIKALLEQLKEMGRPSDEDLNKAAKILDVEKKYTGGKVGDKYYGGGPVYPRPAKGS